MKNTKQPQASEFQEARNKVMMDTFQYASGMTMDEVVEIHVPSTTFPDKNSVEITLNRCVLDNKLSVDNFGRYRKL